MYYHRLLSRKISLKFRELALKSLTFRDAVYIRKHILRIRETRTDAVPTFTQWVNELRVDTMSRKMLKPPGAFTVNVPSWFTSIVVSEQEMQEELKFGAFIARVLRSLKL